MTVETVAEPRGSSPDIRVGRPAGAESGFALVRPRSAAPVVLRPATLADVDALGAMHRRCSPESRYRRYLVATNAVSPANVRWLLTETATTVAEALDGQLVAMGNVALGGVEAEAALLVEDGWQRRGLGVCLAGVLAGQAVAAGARVLTATVFASNVAIRRTMAAAGLAPRIVNCDAGTLELHCDLLHWSQPQPQPLPGPVAPGAGVGSPPCPVNDHPVPRPCARPPPGRTQAGMAATAIATGSRDHRCAGETGIEYRDDHHD